MKPLLTIKRNEQLAFTLIDLLAMVLIIFIVMAYLVLPRLAGSRPANRIKCVSNLKQVGLAFRLWSGDNGGRFPMMMMNTNDGVVSPLYVQTPVSIFRVMSNELYSTKILLCPSDKNRQNELGFPQLSNSNISYFVGLDATEANPQTLLSGDRHITNGLRLRMGMLRVTTNQTVGWTHEMHYGAGNIGFADGSVQQVTIGNLRKAIASTGLATNRLAMP